MMQITRLDRNISDNIVDFNIFNEDATLVKNIVAYFAREFQLGGPENLWGHRILDPMAFANMMEYGNYKSLINPHPNPYQFEGKSKEEIEQLKQLAKDKKITLWNTKLCNALYKMVAKRVILSKPGRTPKGELMDELKEIHFIKRDSLKKYYHPVSHKIYYEYELDEVFLNNLARHFFRIDLKIFNKLRRSGLQDFYLQLTRIKDKATSGTNTLDQNGNIVVDWLNFDQVCDMAKTNCATFSDNKKYINAAVKKINTHAEQSILSVEWVKNGNFLGKPIFRFSENLAEKAEIKADHKERFNRYMFHNLGNVFRELHPFMESETGYKQALMRWLTNIDANHEMKQKTFLDTYMQCYGKTIDRSDNKVFNYLRFEVPEMSKKV